MVAQGLLSLQVKKAIKCVKKFQFKMLFSTYLPIETRWNDVSKIYWLYRKEI